MAARSTAVWSSRSSISDGTGWLERLRRLIREHLWSREPLQPAPLAWGRGALQFMVMVGQGFARDQLLLRAHSLTFLTFLSIAPLVALAVSLAGTLGVRERLVPLLVERIAAGSPEAAEWLASFVQDFRFGALGTLGGAALMATSVLMIGNVERALNSIWGIQKQRTWVRRVPDYLAVLLVAPLVLGVAVSLGTSLQSRWLVQRLLEVPTFSSLYSIGLRQAPTLLMVIGFAFVYWFLPNTDVRKRAALGGGLFAAVLFGLAQQAYVGLSVGVARYDAIFSGLAWVPLFMGWVYFSWSITLLGAEVSFALQTLPLYRRELREEGAGPAAREAIGLAIALEVARAFRGDRESWTEDDLSDALDVPVRTVRDLTARLEDAGILSERGGDARPGTLQLARAADRIRVADVLGALRGPRRAPHGDPELTEIVRRVFEGVDTEMAENAGACSLRELLEADSDGVDPCGSAP